MFRKIRILDLISWLTFIVFIAFIVFLVISIVSYYTWTSDNVALNAQQKTILLILFVVWIIFLVLGVIGTTYCSFNIFMSDWENEYLNSQKKLYFILNVIVVTLCIPAIIYVKQLNKYLVKKNPTPAIKTKNNNVASASNETTVDYNQNYEISDETIYQEADPLDSSENIVHYSNVNYYFDGTDYWMWNEELNDWQKVDYNEQ